MTIQEKAEQLAGLINRPAPAILNEQELASYAEYVELELVVKRGDAERSPQMLIHEARLADPAYQTYLARRRDLFWRKIAQEDEQAARHQTFLAEGASRQKAAGQAKRARIEHEYKRLRRSGKRGALSGVIERNLKIPRRTVTSHLRALGLG